MVTINCGAIESVRDRCGLAPSVRVIVIDSHRPVWHGYNVEANDNDVVVLDDDDPVPIQEVPVWSDVYEQGQEDDEDSGVYVCVSVCACTRLTSKNACVRMHPQPRALKMAQRHARCTQCACLCVCARACVCVCVSSHRVIG